MSNETKRPQIYLRLGTAIKTARWKRVMKQKDLAKKLEVSQPHLSEIERGRKGPSIELLASIEEILGPVWSAK